MGLWASSIGKVHKPSESHLLQHRDISSNCADTSQGHKAEGLGGGPPTSIPQLQPVDNAVLPSNFV
jgi:hypothetical protein